MSGIGFAKLFVAGYLALGVVWLVAGLAGNLLALAALEPRFGFAPDFGFVAAVPAIALVFLLPMYVVGLVLNLPLLMALRVARHRVSPRAARWAAAIGMACWGEWMLFRMEWFDVWRHGAPGLGYWLTTLAPWGVAWASAGAVVGGSVVRAHQGEADPDVASLEPPAVLQ